MSALCGGWKRGRLSARLGPLPWVDFFQGVGECELRDLGVVGGLGAKPVAVG